MKSSCQSEEEDTPAEVLVVGYNYTVEASDKNSAMAIVDEMEGSIHETIVDDLLSCEDPVIVRRKLSGIRHSRKLILGNTDEQLKIVGADPSPKDEIAKTSEYDTIYVSSDSLDVLRYFTIFLFVFN